MFTRAEIKLFQTNVDEGWHNVEKIFISHVTTALRRAWPLVTHRDILTGLAINGLMPHVGMSW